MISAEEILLLGRKFKATITGIEGRENFDLWFDMPTPGELSGDPFAAALLPIAMKLGSDLRISEAVSPLLLRQLAQIQTIWASWYGWTPINIYASTKKIESKTDGIACFFSGGVDSFYSLLKYQKTDRQPTHLIFVHGFDVPLHNLEQLERIKKHMIIIADELRIEPVFPSTNIRELTSGITSWGNVQHGAAMAAISLCSPFRHVIIPSSYPFSNLFPWGSHPLVDPLWSNERVNVIHDGCEATRVQKVRAISNSPLVLDNIRVCWKTEDTYNCGSCEKCIRTMVNFIAAGSLERCRTLPTAVKAEDLAQCLKKTSLGAYLFSKDNLQALEQSGIRTDLQDVLRKTIRKYEAKTSGKGEKKHISKTKRLSSFLRSWKGTS